MKDEIEGLNVVRRYHHHLDSYLGSHAVYNFRFFSVCLVNIQKMCCWCVRSESAAVIIDGGTNPNSRSFTRINDRQWDKAELASAFESFSPPSLSTLKLHRISFPVQKLTTIQLQIN